MKNNETYSVVDPEGYCIAIASSAANEFAAPVEDLYTYCSLSEIKSILNENCIGYDDNDRPLINKEIHAIIFETVLHRAQSVALSKLASEGYLECAWDENLNDMVFWLSDKNYYSP